MRVKIILSSTTAAEGASYTQKQKMIIRNKYKTKNLEKLKSIMLNQHLITCWK